MQTIESLVRRTDNLVSALNPQVGEPVFATRNCDKHGEYQAKQLIPGRFAMCPTCRTESEEAEKREREAMYARIGVQISLSEAFISKFGEVWA